MKRNTIAIISASIAVVAIGFSVLFYNNSKKAEAQIRYENERAFSEVITSVSKIDTAIEKSSYSTTPAYTVSMLAEVWKQAEVAKSNLSQLPVDIDMTQTQDFIAKIGDYSLAMLRKVANGDKLTDEEMQNISNFSDKVNQLSIELMEAKQIYNNGDSKDYIMDIQTFEGETVKNVGNFDSQTENSVDQKNQEFATMIYDGPFSSHIDKLEAELTKNDEEITEDMAKEKVAKFLQTDISQVEFVGRVDTQIPIYKFKSTKEDDEISIDVTVKGGHVVNFINYRKTSQPTIDAKQAVEVAKEMLKQAGYKDFVETYYIDEDDIVTINFAFSQDGVILYSDLLKISIYKDDSTLAGVEARGYVMSHRERSDITPTISKEKARAVVSNKLEITDESIAIIPTSGKNEVLTYEFKCQNDKKENYIVYVNAKTGQIENMLILIEDENGTLTM